MLNMCDAEFVPEAVEYTTAEDGMKRVGFIEGEEPKMTPLPKEKEKEKEEEEKAIKAMEALNLKDETPPGDGEGGDQDQEKDAEEEDVNNGADFDVVVPSELSLFYPLHPKLSWKQNLLQREMHSLCLLQSLRPSQIDLLQLLFRLMPLRLYVVSFVVHC